MENEITDIKYRVFYVLVFSTKKWTVRIGMLLILLLAFLYMLTLVPCLNGCVAYLHIIKDDLGAQWARANTIGLIFDIGTLLGLFVVWLYEIQAEWENALKKFITVQFVTGDNKLKPESVI